MANRQMAKRTKGAMGADAGAYIGNDVWIFSISGAPTNGASGDGAGFAGPGSILCSDSGQSYTNTNTKASPTWTANT